MTVRFLETRPIALERDKYICQHCGEPLDMTQGHYAVHHLNYSSDEPENLISLCVRCHHTAHVENDIEKDPNNNHKPIKLTDETYWMLRDKREKMTKDLDRQVTYDDVIRYLFTRELISLRQGE